MHVAAQFGNTVWLAMPEFMAADLRLPGNCTERNANPRELCGQPAAPGDYLVPYGTGMGKTTPDGDPNRPSLATGEIPPADGSVLYKTVVAPIVTVGGVSARILFAGLAPGFPGLNQVVIQVPESAPSGDRARGNLVS